MVRNVPFHRDKFRELIVYIAARTADDPGFGDVKMNKVLHFADFVAYSDLGAPITGARYQKLELGPAAVALLPVRDELVKEGAVEVRMVPAGPRQRRVTIAKRDADKSLFREGELELVDELVEIFKGHSATAVSEISHTASPGWNLVGLHDDIPYETALIECGPPPDEVLAMGRELAKQHGW